MIINGMAVNAALRALVLEQVATLEMKGYSRSEAALLVSMPLLSLGAVLALGNGISPTGLRETVEAMLAEWERDERSEAAS